MERVNRQEQVFLGRSGITVKIKWVLKLGEEQGLGSLAEDEVNSRFQGSSHSSRVSPPHKHTDLLSVC